MFFFPSLVGVYLSSDFIAGFCGETEEAHKETITLLQEVEYHFAYTFPYSMRQVNKSFFLHFILM